MERYITGEQDEILFDLREEFRAFLKKVENTSDDIGLNSSGRIELDDYLWTATDESDDRTFLQFVEDGSVVDTGVFLS